MPLVGSNRSGHSHFCLQPLLPFALREIHLTHFSGRLILRAVPGAHGGNAMGLGTLDPGSHCPLMVSLFLQLYRWICCGHVGILVTKAPKIVSVQQPWKVRHLRQRQASEAAPP